MSYWSFKLFYQKKALGLPRAHISQPMRRLRANHLCGQSQWYRRTMTETILIPTPEGSRKSYPKTQSRQALSMLSDQTTKNRIWKRAGSATNDAGDTPFSTPPFHQKTSKSEIFVFIISPRVVIPSGPLAVNLIQAFCKALQ